MEGKLGLVTGRLEEVEASLEEASLEEANRELTKAEEEVRSLRLQGDAELQKKKEATEEERKEVDEDWAKRHFFCGFMGPKTWMEAARRTHIELDQCRIWNQGVIGRLRAELMETGEKATALRVELVIAARKEKEAGDMDMGGTGSPSRKTMRKWQRKHIWRYRAKRRRCQGEKKRAQPTSSKTGGLGGFRGSDRSSTAVPVCGGSERLRRGRGRGGRGDGEGSRRSRGTHQLADKWDSR